MIPATLPKTPPGAGQRARSAWNQNAGTGRLYQNRATLQAALPILESDLDHLTSKQDPKREDAIKRIRFTKYLIAVTERQIAALEGRA